jgi:DNA modification methylase
MDPFSGRGTTGIICRKLKRRFVGIDLYPNNISLSRRNIQNVSAYD